MLPLNTIFPSLHFGHCFSIFPFAIAFASFPASPSTCLLGHFLFKQKSLGCFPLLMATTIGNPHVSQIFCAGLIKALEGKDIAVLHFGYWLHAAKCPNFPLLICKFPLLQTGHFPKLDKASLVSILAASSSLPISFSFFLKSYSILVIAPLASCSTSSFFILSSMIFSISPSKCLVSSSSTILGAYFSRVSTVLIPRFVASIDFPST